MRSNSINKFLVWLCFSFIILITFCYVVPVILVYFGLGRVIFMYVSYLPWLISLTKNQFSLFLLSGILLLITDRFLQNSIKDLPKTTQEHLSSINIYLFNLSLVFWIISFILAYLLTPVLLFMEVT
jgi:hypothetical protein